MEIVGLDLNKIENVSRFKGEDDWVLEYRKKAFDLFQTMPLPNFGPKIDLDFNKIVYYKASKEDQVIRNNWQNILKPIREELTDLKVIESEKHLAGMGVQWESEVIYHNMIEELIIKILSLHLLKTR